MNTGLMLITILSGSVVALTLYSLDSRIQSHLTNCRFCIIPLPTLMFCASHETLCTKENLK